VHSHTLGQLWWLQHSDHSNLHKIPDPINIGVPVGKHMTIPVLADLGHIFQTLGSPRHDLHSALNLAIPENELTSLRMATDQ
jgi:hypothetical protein